MLWNWYTVDSCFLVESWHNETKAHFAGTVLGVFLLAMSVEGIRRIGRIHDRQLVAALNAAKRNAKCGCGSKNAADLDSESKFVKMHCRPKIPEFPSWSQQAVRGGIYGIQFTVAFLLMLLGMYFNGYILFAIFLGGATGFTLFGSDTLAAGANGKVITESPCCC
jgi:copper transporter 1